MSDYAWEQWENDPYDEMGTKTLYNGHLGGRARVRKLMMVDRPEPPVHIQTPPTADDMLP